MTPFQTMIYEAIRFANWAAGEGLAPAAGEPAKSPEDFLFDYSQATGDESWDDLPERAAQMVVAVEQTVSTNAGE